jgi:putative membrane protein
VHDRPHPLAALFPFFPGSRPRLPGLSRHVPRKHHALLLRFRFCLHNRPSRLSKESDMSRRFLVPLAASALALGLACTASAQSSALNATDSAFMEHAIVDGMAEVQMGQLALDKSSDAQVKQLAQRIVTDHKKADHELRKLAVRKHVRLPATPTADAQQEAASMKQMEGADFDRAWAAAMVKDHNKAIDMFTTESQQAKDADLRKFAESTTPTLRTHLEMAQKLNGGASMDPSGMAH